MVATKMNHRDTEGTEERGSFPCREGGMEKEPHVLVLCPAGSPLNPMVAKYTSPSVIRFDRSPLDRSKQLRGLRASVVQFGSIAVLWFD